MEYEFGGIMNIADYIRKKNAETESAANVKETLDKYSTYSEEQLMSELFRLGSLSEGKISAKELDDFYEKASPFLTPEQSARMKDLITQLKNS